MQSYSLNTILRRKSRSRSRSSSAASSDSNGYGSTVKFSGYLLYLDGTSTKMYVKGEMTKRDGKIENGWYCVKTMSMEKFSSPGTLTGSVDSSGNLGLQTWRDGVQKTSLKGALGRGEITLAGQNGDNIPVKWVITLQNFNEKPTRVKMN